MNYTTSSRILQHARDSKDSLMEERDNRARTRAARLVKKATGVKYTEALRYVERLHEDEQEAHYHFLSRYGDPYQVDGETIYRLRCATCGGNTFAFATKTSTVVED